MNEFDNDFGKNENPNEAVNDVSTASAEPTQTPFDTSINQEKADDSSFEKSTDEQNSDQTIQFNDVSYSNQQFTPQNNGYYQQYSAKTIDYSTPNQNVFEQQPTPVKTTNSGGKKTGFKVFCVLVAIAVLFSVGIGVGYFAADNNDLKSDNSQNDFNKPGGTVVIEQGTVPTQEGIKPDSNGKYTPEQVASLVSKSVVNITVYSENSSSTAIASGVILDKSGYIISNDHIYSEIPLAKFIITMNDGNSYSAEYVAGDSRSDLCVLKFTEMPQNLTPATFADSTKLKSGMDVIAIGSPSGFSDSVTKGIISSPSRRISRQAQSLGTTTSSYSMRVIQTDTPLNSGNSGGALVNMYGQVVGISSSKMVVSGYEGLCFAIPSNDALKYCKSLIENKKVVGRAKLGITYNEISSSTAKINNYPSGLYIGSVDIESDLYNMGLTKGDIITEINGKKITSADVALDIVDDSKAGDTVQLKVYKTDSKKTVSMSVSLLEDKSVSSYSTKIEQPSTEISPLW